jgi:hypothetical protein
MKTHRQEIAMQQLSDNQLGQQITDGGSTQVTNPDGSLVDTCTYIQEVELVEVSNANHGDAHLNHLNIIPQQMSTLVHFQHQSDLGHELGVEGSLMSSEQNDFQNVLVTDMQLQNALGHGVSHSSVFRLSVVLSVKFMKDEMAQSVQCWPFNREIWVQLPAEESHSS